jgi:splicing factor U2AF subunit
MHFIISLLHALILQPDGGMMTRHARRIYAGGIPPRATEIEIANFFNDIVTRALAPVRPDTLPVQKVYLNTEKCYAFVEFSTIELTTACMALDGVKFDHYTGSTIVRVRRPNDYRPEMLPPPGPIPVLNVSVLGITGVSSSMGGPGKVFIGGLPYNLQDEQVMELMGAFGAIKAFHQVRDPGSVTSKGYGFCEYVNPANAEQAIAGLNGMALGDKTLTVRIATQGASNSSGGGGGAAAAMLQLQQMMMGMGGLGGMPGMGGMGGIGQPPIGAMGAGAYGAGAGMGGMPMGAGGMGTAPAGGAIGGHPPSRVSPEILL